MVCVIIVFYWREYGPINFLWFSDIALILMVPALWFESALIASMMGVGVLALELSWFIDFATGGNLSGLAEYMFEPDRPLWLRGLSLFHIPMPLVIIYAIYKLGYDRRALFFQTLLAWIVLPLTYIIDEPGGENINWVFGLGGEIQTLLQPLVYLGLLMLGILIFIYFPTHWILRKFFQPAQ